MARVLLAGILSAILGLAAGIGNAATYHLRDVAVSDGSALFGSFDWNGTQLATGSVITHSSGRSFTLYDAGGQPGTLGWLEYRNLAPAPSGTFSAIVLWFFPPLSGSVAKTGIDRVWYGRCAVALGLCNINPTSIDYETMFVDSGYVMAAAPVPPPVPLPAALPLSLAGIAALTGLGMRRRHG